MADTDRMVHVTQCKLEELVGQNGGGIGESKKRMVGKDGPQSHCSCVEDGFSTEATETGMTVDNLNLLPNDNVAEYGKERKDGREGGFPVDNEERDVVDFQAIGEVADSCSTFVRMRDYDDFVSAVDEFLESCQE
ncbi:hypothetical protein PENSUB_9767 [Penicillium subrubescens]|uniref:Uncharacterized protein n=1 Tax=Penicillium subrubescens TaxID=1316194 RepID=A0A1Q5TC87_9EURO|nr:hypothetical protein PENSUB_9767 [Penicillium subrubescens]